MAFSSTVLDEWTHDQLRKMREGGNNRAKLFFRAHGWGDLVASDSSKIHAKVRWARRPSTSMG